MKLWMDQETVDTVPRSLMNFMTGVSRYLWQSLFLLTGLFCYIALIFFIVKDQKSNRSISFNNRLNKPLSSTYFKQTLIQFQKDMNQKHSESISKLPSPKTEHQCPLTNVYENQWYRTIYLNHYKNKWKCSKYNKWKCSKCNKYIVVRGSMSCMPSERIFIHVKRRQKMLA